MSNPNEVKVKRYHDYGAATGCFPCVDGGWVKYSDYQSLELENKRLREALEKSQFGSCDGCGRGGYCTECQECESDGHKNGCYIGEALKR